MFGGLVPFIGTWLVDSSGNKLAGVWYPIAIASITFVVGHVPDNAVMAFTRATLPVELFIAIPGDAQWRRITRRMGPPAFLIIAADELHQRIYAPGEVGLALRIEKNGSDVVAAPSNHVPYTYSSDSAQKGFEFTAVPGDHVTIHAHATAATIPSDVSLTLTPYWNSFKMWDWVDGAAIGLGIGGVIALGLAIVGVALVGVAVALALRERPRATPSKS